MNRDLIFTTISVFVLNTLVLIAASCTFLFIWADLKNWYSFMMYISLLSCVASAFFSFMSVRSLCILIENERSISMKGDIYMFYAFTTSIISLVSVIMILFDFEYGARTIMRAPLPELITVITSHVFFNSVSCLMVVYEITRKKT